MSIVMIVRRVNRNIYTNQIAQSLHRLFRRHFHQILAWNLKQSNNLKINSITK